MAQFTNAVEARDIESVLVDSAELVFLDDASYEYVGGGDTYNGY